MKYVLAIDQGTTSSRAIIFDKAQHIVSISQKEYQQIYLPTGYIEQDPLAIYSSAYAVMMEAILSGNIAINDIKAIGIANQRETTIVWEKATGKPIYNAIGWQCRRTAPICEELKKAGLADYVQKTTGLIIDAYFSATKLKWILDNVKGARERAENGELLFGTVDTFLIWKLTGGAAHVTDYTNASRTMLYNISTLAWDDKLLKILNIPKCMLPTVKSCSEIYGYVNISGTLVPIAGASGDQQAALFGQCCFTRGTAKNTYGTGCFFLMNTGAELCFSKNRMLSTIAMGINGNITYAIEGSVFTGGAVIKWLRDEMGLIRDSADSEYFAEKVKNNSGVYVVPAFTGLGAPHWDMYAEGIITGLVRGTNRNHIIRAALESIAYQSKDVINAIFEDTGLRTDLLCVDGGASENNFLMQFQADILNIPVARSDISETTALGAAYLAGLAVGVWESMEEISAIKTHSSIFHPQMSDMVRNKNIDGWQKALRKCMEFNY